VPIKICLLIARLSAMPPTGSFVTEEIGFIRANKKDFENGEVYIML